MSRKAQLETMADIPGVFSMLHGGVRVGEALVQHPHTKAVGFTGSFQGKQQVKRILNSIIHRRKAPL
jgi:acyl-CoA reductase-like NAD-dependent aldehyde dehydrogenase